MTGYPANVLLCENCNLVQLGLIVDPEKVFPPTYPYTSGTTRILRENFGKLFDECNKIIGLSSDDLIVDVGSNDGTLLSNFKKGGCRVLGIEPTDVGEIARKAGINTVRAYFGPDIVPEIIKNYGKAKIITAFN